MICPICFEQMRAIKGRNETIFICEAHKPEIVRYCNDHWHYYQGDTKFELTGIGLVHLDIVELAKTHDMLAHGKVCGLNTANKPENCMICPLVSKFDGQKMCYDQFIKGLKK